MSTTKVVLGLLGAVAAGAIVGLLLAPEKGIDMRKRVSRTATDWAGHLSDLFANAKGEVDSMTDQARRTASGDDFNNISESYS